MTIQERLISISNEAVKALNTSENEVARLTADVKQLGARNKELLSEKAALKAELEFVRGELLSEIEALKVVKAELALAKKTSMSPEVASQIADAKAILADVLGTTHEATPEVTPEVKATPQRPRFQIFKSKVTPKVEVTPEVEATPEVTPEVEVTSEVTPEVTPKVEATLKVEDVIKDDAEIVESTPSVATIDGVKVESEVTTFTFTSKDYFRTILAKAEEAALAEGLEPDSLASFEFMYDFIVSASAEEDIKETIASVVDFVKSKVDLHDDNEDAIPEEDDFEDDDDDEEDDDFEDDELAEDPSDIEAEMDHYEGDDSDTWDSPAEGGDDELLGMMGVEIHDNEEENEITAELNAEVYAEVLDNALKISSGFHEVGSPVYFAEAYVVIKSDPSIDAEIQAKALAEIERRGAEAMATPTKEEAMATPTKEEEAPTALPSIYIAKSLTEYPKKHRKMLTQLMEVLPVVEKDADIFVTAQRVSTIGTTEKIHKCQWPVTISGEGNNGSCALQNLIDIYIRGVKK